MARYMTHMIWYRNRKGRILMKNIKKPAAVLCALAVAAGAGAPALENVFDIDTAIVASADERPTSGTFGENITWSFDKSNGVLTIGGTGNMGDTNSAPWMDFQMQITSVIIKNGVTNIGGFAFQGLYELKNVSMPDSITSIDKYAFYACRSIETIRLSSRLKTIDTSAFACCAKLKSIYIPDTVTWIESSAFNGCTALKNVGLPYGLSTLPYLMFADCTSLESIVIPASVNYIGYDAFYKCSNLKNVTIFGNKVSFNNADYGVFYSCAPSLTIHCYAGSDAENYAIENGIAHDNYVSSGVLYGDVNDDRVVNSSDIASLQQYIAGWNTAINLKAADVNVDGSINGSDLSRLQQKLAGWQVALGVR